MERERIKEVIRRLDKSMKLRGKLKRNKARKTKMSSKQLVVFDEGLNGDIYRGVCAIPPVSRKASMWGRKTRVKIFA